MSKTERTNDIKKYQGKKKYQGYRATGAFKNF